MEEALHDMPLYREFARLDNRTTRLPDESTILRFRHLLEKHRLAAQMLVVINDMLQDKVLMLRAGTVVDAALIAAPSSTKNTSGTRDPKMHQKKKDNRCNFGMKPTLAPMPSRGWCRTVRGTASSIRAKVKHLFRVIKRQSGYGKIRYRGLTKSTAQLTTLFALSDPVDGARQVDGSQGLSAPDPCADGPNSAESGQLNARAHVDRCQFEPCVRHSGADVPVQ